MATFDMDPIGFDALVQRPAGRIHLFANNPRGMGVTIGAWFKSQQDGKVAVATTMVMRWVPPDDEQHVLASHHAGEFLHLSMAEAQELADALWQGGIRPTAGAGSAGQLAAVERHLEDARAFAFGLIGDRVTMPQAGGRRG